MSELHKRRLKMADALLDVNKEKEKTKWSEIKKII